ncbi:uncharacterized protein RHIMIDRAFT_236266 [Rhizopus microsporus ATCC 52813]|uniref:Uncharacterized protein n=1 Tax=Rhizopus microsporus ATCC 52813 TaxID=1340429 RepID=A0A2G4SZT2_RHIZD|nr:uncharacterized protein RHIMIDRAFT_236266 [Rhizopus microsporus ATCC 52813]PHZ14285.1 hypothetical protein RHIMIDRAFT_236266 [Rhizopus microsporus ATCC 52813]
MKLPVMPIGEDFSETELCSWFVKPFVSGIFDDLDNDTYLCWTNEPTLEAKSMRESNGRPDICITKFCGVQAKKAVKGRGTLSAIAIGLSGLASLLFDAAFPQFDPKASQSNSNKFKTNATSFFSANEYWPTVDDSNTA